MDRVQQLIEELKRGSPEVRRRAVIALGKKSDPRAMDALIGSLNDEDLFVIYSARDGLTKIGKRAVMPLIKALEDKAVQFRAKETLEQIGRPAIPPLIEALKDADIKSMASHTLSAMGRQTIRPLIEALGKPEIRDEAALTLYILKELHAEPVEEPLLGALKIPVYREGALRALKYIIMRHLAMQLSVLRKVLAVLKEQQAINDIEKHMSEFIPLLVNLLNGTSRFEAVGPLCLLGTLATPHLINLIKDNTKSQDARWCAVDIFGETRDQSSVEVLIKALEEESSIVSLKAAEVLGKIGDTRALKPLLSVIRNNSSAIEALASSTTLGRALDIFNRNSDKYFCVRCFCRFERQKIESASRRSLNFFACRTCSGISYIMEDIESVAVVLDSTSRGHLNRKNATQDKGFKTRKGEVIHNLEELIIALRNMDDPTYQQHITKSRNEFAKWVRDILGYPELAQELEKLEDRIWAALKVEEYLDLARYISDSKTLSINWFRYREPFDFDEVWIKDADDFEIEEFVMKIRNDVDHWRQGIYRNIPVFLRSDNRLSQAKLNLLKDTFAKVEVKATEE